MLWNIAIFLKTKVFEETVDAILHIISPTVTTIQLHSQIIYKRMFIDDRII